jgi:hypothetical protein
VGIHAVRMADVKAGRSCHGYRRQTRSVCLTVALWCRFFGPGIVVSGVAKTRADLARKMGATACDSSVDQGRGIFCNNLQM